MLPYILNKNSTFLYEVIQSLEHRYNPLSEQTTFLFKDSMIKLDHESVNSAVQVVLDMTESVDEALANLAPAIFISLHSLQ